MAKKKATKKAAKKPRDPAPAEGPASKYPWIAAELQALAVPIESVETDPKNARTHDEANIRAVMKSLRRRGQYSPLLGNSKNGQIVIGNCRLLAAQRLGWSHVAILWREVSETEQAEYSIVDNRSAELADWDDTILSELLSSIEAEDPDRVDLLRFELLLGDLEPREKREESGPELTGLEYRIVVLCESEEHQAEWLARLEKEGLNCQALIS